MATFPSFTESPYSDSINALAPRHVVEQRDGRREVSIHVECGQSPCTDCWLNPPRRGTFIIVDHDTYYTLFDDDLVGLAASPHLPENFVEILQRRIDVFLGRAVLTVGAWKNEPARPDVLVLDISGCLTSVLTVGPDDLNALPNRLSDINSWLANMRLRDLSDVSGDPAAFYEGLWDLSPDASITLSSRRRTVILTALDAVDVPVEPSSNGPAVEIQYVDVFTTLGGGAPILKRRTPTLADMARVETAISPLADIIDLTHTDLSEVERSTKQSTHGYADAVSGDETTMADPPRTTELSAPSERPTRVSPIDASILSPTPRIRPGATFAIDRLPLLFDPLGANLTSISDELFAVDQHLVLVEKLPERRRETPFEDRNRFRWDSSPAEIQLLNTHGLDDEQRPRTTHLFVETERQSGYCVYIGELHRIESPRHSTDRAAWFSVKPTLDSDLYRMLRKGRLPKHIESPTIDFGTLDA